MLSRKMPMKIGWAATRSVTAALHVDFGSVVGGRYDGIAWHVFCERKESQNQKLHMK